MKEWIVMGFVLLGVVGMILLDCLCSHSNKKLYQMLLEEQERGTKRWKSWTNTARKNFLNHFWRVA